MTSKGYKISACTVEAFISSSVDSHIIYQTKHYDVKGNNTLPKKLHGWYDIERCCVWKLRKRRYWKCFASWVDL